MNNTKDNKVDPVLEQLSADMLAFGFGAVFVDDKGVITNVAPEDVYIKENEVDE